MESEHILLTYEEAAAAERVSPITIASRVHRGLMKAERNGGRPRIPIGSLSPTAQARAREILREREVAG